MESKPVYKVKRSEHDEQVALLEWAALNEFRLPDLRWLFAVPNGARLTWKTDNRGNRYSSEAQRLRKEGLKRGVPDLFLPVPKGRFHGMFIEMKAEGGEPSDEQMAWLEALNDRGYLAALAFGFEEATELIEDYLSLRSIE